MSKKVNIEMLLKTTIDTSGFKTIKKEIDSLFSDKTNIEKFSKGLLEELNVLEERFKSLLSREVDKDSSKAVLLLAKDLESFVKDYEKFLKKLDSKELAEAIIPTKEIQKKIDENKKAFADFETEIKNQFKKDAGVKRFMEYKIFDVDAQEQNIQALQEKLEKKEQELRSVRAKMGAAKSKETKDEFAQERNKLVGELDELKERVEREKVRLAENRQKAEMFAQAKGQIQLKRQETEVANAALEAQKQIAIQEQANETGRAQAYASAIKGGAEVRNSVMEIAGATKTLGDEMHSTETRTSALTNKLTYMTSTTFILYKAFTSLKKGIGIVENLDRSITGIATVTGQTRDQAWEAYDSFKDLADRLNATTQEISEAALLYYQQGLGTGEVMEIVEATTVAATLAQVNFAEASDRMTSAIRGFNLEMSQSMHITDVFSSLAAYTAADFNEISYALTKTASIAHTANMTLENTTAFLAKMIETTREAPQNIGTAMKSIIARMAELKKSPTTILEDGVDFNRVATALKTARVELVDFNKEMRPFDEILMELGNKWEYLDRNTQSYIATTIAGNRQQSRFLALMNDFTRTMELVEMANNSAGEASQMFSTYLTGVEAATKRVEQAQESLANSLIDGGYIIAAKDLYAGLLNTIAALGPAGTAAAGTLSLTGLAITKNILSQKLLRGEQSLATTAVKLFSIESLKSGESVKQFSANIRSSFERLDVFKKSTANLLKDGGLKGLASGFKEGAVNAGSFLKNIGASIGVLIQSIAIYIAVAAAIAAVAAAIYLWITREKRLIENQKKNINEQNDRIKQYKEESDNIERLVEKYDEYSSKITLLKEDQEDFIKVQQELAELFPTIVTGYDKEGNAILGNNAALKEQIALRQEELKVASIESSLSRAKSQVKLQKRDEWSDEVSALQKEYSRLTIEIQKAKRNEEDITDLMLERASISEKMNVLKTKESTNIFYQYGNALASSLALGFEAQNSESTSKINSLITSSAGSLVENLVASYKGNIKEITDREIDEMFEQLDNGLSSLQDFLNNYTIDDINLGEFIYFKKEDFKGTSEEIDKVYDEVTKGIVEKAIEQFADVDFGNEEAVRKISEAIEQAVQDGTDYNKILKGMGFAFTDEQKSVIDALAAVFGNLHASAKDGKEEVDALSKSILALENTLTIGGKRQQGFYSQIGTQVTKELGSGAAEVLNKVIQSTNAEMEEEVIDFIASLLQKTANQRGLFNEILGDVDPTDTDSIANLIDQLQSLEGISSEDLTKFVGLIANIDPSNIETLTKSISQSEKRIASFRELLGKPLSTEELVEFQEKNTDLAGEIIEQNGQFFVSSSALFQAQVREIEQQRLVQQRHIESLRKQLQDAEAHLDRFAQEIEQRYKGYTFTYIDAKQNKEVEVTLAQLRRLFEEGAIGKEEFDDALSDYKALEGYSIAVQTVIDRINELTVANSMVVSTRGVMDTVYQNAISMLGGLAKQTNLLNKAQEDLNTYNAITLDTFQSIINSNLLDYIEITSTGINIHKEAVEKLNEEYRTQIYNQVYYALLLAETSKGQDDVVESTGRVSRALKDHNTELVRTTNLTIAEALASGSITQEQLGTIQAQTEGIVDALMRSSSVTATTGKGAGKSIEDLYDRYYTLKQAVEAYTKALDLNKEQAELAKDDYYEENRLMLARIDLLKQLQDALHALNQARREEIAGKIRELEGAGAIVEYNAATNDFVVANMDALKATGKLTPAILETVKAIESLVKENEDASKAWRQHQREIDETRKTFEDYVADFKRSAVKQLGYIIDTIENERRNDKQLDVWRRRLEALEAEESALKQINEDLKEQRALLEELRGEKSKAVYYEDRGWVWEVDTDAIKKTEKDIEKLEKDYTRQYLKEQIDKREKMYQESINSLQKQIENFNFQLSILERANAITYDDMIKTLEKAGLKTDENVQAMKDLFDNLAKDTISAVEAIQAALNIKILNATLDGSSGGTGSAKPRYGQDDKLSVNELTTLDSLSKAYMDARAQGDYQAMQKANDEANKIRTENKLPTQDASVDIDLVKKRGYNAGGVADFTGTAELHGSKKRPEVVFNSTDAAKLYNFIHSTPDLVAALLGRFSRPIASEQGASNNYSYFFDKLVLPNVTNGKSLLDELHQIKGLVAITGKN